jgi:outer membrane protein OmpA-like peptidoglycan-associated protein/tetratricopeptide (TPR) repeat protein
MINDKKIIKEIQLLKDEADINKASILFQGLYEKYPDYAELPYIMAQKSFAQYQTSKKDPKKSNEAQKLETQAYLLFLSSYNKCQTFHSDNLYLIALILVGRGDTEKAIPFLREFLDFSENDLSKLPNDFKEKKSIAKKFVENYDLQAQFLKNPVPFEPKIVENVSSDLDEYFPMISPDNDLMFFTRKVNRKNLGDITDNIIEEFTLAEHSIENPTQFAKGAPLAPPFNDGTFYNYGTATLSADNKEMIICACKKEKIYEQIYLNCDLYTTTYKRSGKGGNDYQWTPLVNMGSDINTNDGWEAQPSLSSDGRTLFYTTNRKGSQDNDIYFTTRLDDGTWAPGKPFNEINTAGKDKSPFFHQDGQTLYFVSESNSQRPGLGGLDIFYIRKSETGWSKPENIGYPINTEGDELGLFVSTQGKVAYYSSYQNGNWNIYSFDLYERARPKEIVIVKGQLKNEKNEIVRDGKIEIAYGTSDKKMVIDVSQEDGKYAAVVEVKKDVPVTVTLKKEGAAFSSKVITPEDLSTNNVKVDVAVQTLKTGQSYNINDILYSTDSYELQENSKLILKLFSDYLKENSSFKIAIHGHTDDQGDEASNLVLSENRAKSVVEYLVSQGISKNRLSFKGFGESKPKVPNTTAEGRAKNRRTEFLLLSE